MKTLKKITLVSFLIGSMMISTLFIQAQSPVTTPENISYNNSNQPDFWAGEDATICNDREYKTKGISTYAGTAFWGTNGDGTFSNPFNLKTNYQPGPEDIASGQVTLSLVVIPEPTTNPMIDQMVLYLNNCATIKPDER